MNSFNRATAKLKRRSAGHHNYRLSFLFAFILIFVLVLVHKTFIRPASIARFQGSGQIFRSPCLGGSGEKFLWYAPHSGFSNQLSEFKHAILMAAILNRTLIVPPVLDHHAVALGSCPKFRVLEPNDLRFKVWTHSLELIRDRRYISMADIIDLSSLVSAATVRFIDFRVFISMWCGVNLNLFFDANSSTASSLVEKTERCGSLLSGYDGKVDTCLFASQDDCRTTVWTYQSDDDGILDSFQADDELKKKRKISVSRKRKDVYKALGPGSAAEPYTVLALGSLFSSSYKGSDSHIDIKNSPKDQRIQLLIQKIEFLPFVPEILKTGKKFALDIIKVPFLCTQLRLLDGQFKNHWEGTFSALKQKLDLLKQKGPLPIHVFVMTDLPHLNWTGSYLGDLEKDSDSFKLFVLREEDELVAQTAKEVVNAKFSMKLQSAPSNFEGREQQYNALSSSDILLYIEETVCSCASLGFVGTDGSTIASSIELMRKNSICS